MKKKYAELKTRAISAQETARVMTDLALRGWLSLFSAVMIVFYGLILTVHGSPLFSERGISGLCIAAIWIAVVAIDFGLVRSGLQFLIWRKGNHRGVPPSEEASPPGLFDDIVNIAFCVLFVAFGITVLIAGKLGLGDLRTLPQIPLSLLSIAFGLTSGETALFHFWLRKRRLVDVMHEVPDRIEKPELSE